MGLIRVIIVSVLVIVAFISGICLHAAVNKQTIYFSQPLIKSEVRDDRFKKCELSQANGMKDGSTVEAWNCGKSRLFLVKRLQHQTTKGVMSAAITASQAE